VTTSDSYNKVIIMVSVLFGMPVIRGQTYTSILQMYTSTLAQCIVQGVSKVLGQI